MHEAVEKSYRSVINREFRKIAVIQRNRLVSQCLEERVHNTTVAMGCMQLDSNVRPPALHCSHSRKTPFHLWADKWTTQFSFLRSVVLVLPLSYRVKINCCFIIIHDRRVSTSLHYCCLWSCLLTLSRFYFLPDYPFSLPICFSRSGSSTSFGVRDGCALQHNGEILFPCWFCSMCIYLLNLLTTLKKDVFPVTEVDCTPGDYCLLFQTVSLIKFTHTFLPFLYTLKHICNLEITLQTLLLQGEVPLLM